MPLVCLEGGLAADTVNSRAQHLCPCNWCNNVLGLRPNTAKAVVAKGACTCMRRCSRTLTSRCTLPACLWGSVRRSSARTSRRQSCVLVQRQRQQVQTSRASQHGYLSWTLHTWARILQRTKPSSGHNLSIDVTAGPLIKMTGSLVMAWL